MKNFQKPSISIAKRSIGIDFPPYVIAEMSANHNGKIENAFKIIDEAKKNGADAVKIQTYSPDTITLNVRNDEFKIFGGKWDGRYLYDLYKEAHMPWEWHKEIFDHAKSKDLTIFSSPFDSTAVDLLESLNAPAYKIASFEAVDLPLIKYVANTKKPMIISTGMCNLDEIKEAINAAQEGGCNELSILHCVSGYPASPSSYNLKTIPDIIGKFDLVTGLSDHTLSNASAVASIALGSSIIEKHFTLDRNKGGPDDSFSIEPKDLKLLSDDVRDAWNALGNIDYSLKVSEKGEIKFRRSLYFIKDLEAGSILTKNSVRSVRPGFGLAPKYLDRIIGKKLLVNVKKNTPVNKKFFKDFK